MLASSDQRQELRELIYGLQMVLAQAVLKLKELEKKPAVIHKHYGGGGIRKTAADTRYVNVAGDTMTGDLDIASNNIQFTDARLVSAAGSWLYVKNATGGASVNFYASNSYAANLYGQSKCASVAFRGYDNPSYLETKATNDNILVFRTWTGGAWDEVARMYSGLFELSNGKLTGALDCNSQNLTSCGDIKFANTLIHQFSATRVDVRDSGDTTHVDFCCNDIIPTGWVEIYGDSKGIRHYLGTSDLDTYITTSNNAAASWILRSYDGGAYVENIKIMGGNVLMENLPGADPHVAGALWSNGGVVTVSAG